MCSPQWIYAELLNLKLQEEKATAQAGMISVRERTELRLARARGSHCGFSTLARWVSTVVWPRKLGRPA
jgi:hypothetical protein